MAGVGGPVCRARVTLRKVPKGAYRCRGSTAVLPKSARRAVLKMGDSRLIVLGSGSITGCAWGSFWARSFWFERRGRCG